MVVENYMPGQLFKSTKMEDSEVATWERRPEMVWRVRARSC